MLTLVNVGLGDTLPPLSVTEQTNGDGNVLACERAFLVFVREVPYFSKHGRGQLRTAEDLDSGFTVEDADLLGVGVGEYLVDESYLLGRGRELGHGGYARLEEVEMRKTREYTKTAVLRRLCHLRACVRRRPSNRPAVSAAAGIISKNIM